MDDALARRYAAFKEEFAARCTELGRTADEVTLIVVTKFHPAGVVRDLLELGQREFGESRHQEAVEKAADPALAAATWHFIGQLQTNKAKQVAKYASFIHSIDRSRLVSALADGERVRSIGCFLELDLTGETGRGGADESSVLPLADQVTASSGLSLLGVMGVPAAGEDPHRGFERLAKCAERLRAVHPEASAISAGMSGDWRVALEFGATHLRIGTTITGKRPDPSYA